VLLEQGLSLEEAAQRLSLPKGTLANWVKAATRGSMASASAPGSRSVAALEEENARSRRELAVERMEKEVLKKGHRVLRSGVAARYAQLKTVRPDYPIALRCRVFDVSRSGFYSWFNRKPSRRQQTDEQLKVAIKAAHRQSRETYGVRRMQPELEEQGFASGRDRIGRLRKELGLHCKPNASLRPRPTRAMTSQ
jgi:putative transposase